MSSSEDENEERNGERSEDSESSTSPREEEEEVKPKKYKKLVETSKTGIWHIYYPPIQFRNPKRGLSWEVASQLAEQGEESFSFRKPDVNAQWKYIIKERITIWDQLRKGEGMGNLEAAGIFDATFSPSIFLFDKSEDKISSFRHFDQIPYLSLEKSEELTRKCENVVKLMKKNKEEYVKQLEDRIDEQIKLYEECVLQRYSTRRDICVGSKNLEEKLKNDDVILSESNPQPLSRLIMECSDVLTIVLDFLVVRDVLLGVMPTCSFFSHFIQKKVGIRMIISPQLFERIPIDMILNRFRIKGFIYGRKPNARQYPKIVQVDRLVKFLDKVKFDLRYLRIKDLHRYIFHKNQKNKYTFGGNESHFEDLEITLKRFKPFYDKIGECKRIELLESHIVPNDLTRLTNIKRLIFEIPITRLETISSSNSTERIIDELDSSGINRLVEYFRVGDNRLRWVSIYFQRATHSVQNALLSKNTLEILETFFDAIADSKKLNYYYGPILVDFRSFSAKFINFLSTVRLFRLTLEPMWGVDVEKDMFELNEDEEDKKMMKYQLEEDILVRSRMERFEDVLEENYGQEVDHEVLASRKNRLVLKVIVIREEFDYNCKNSRSLFFVRNILKSLTGVIVNLRIDDTKRFIIFDREEPEEQNQELNEEENDQNNLNFDDGWVVDGEDGRRPGLEGQENGGGGDGNGWNFNYGEGGRGDDNGWGGNDLHFGDWGVLDRNNVDEGRYGDDVTELEFFGQRLTPMIYFMRWMGFDKRSKFRGLQLDLSFDDEDFYSSKEPEFREEIKMLFRKMFSSKNVERFKCTMCYKPIVDEVPKDFKKEETKKMEFWSFGRFMMKEVIELDKCHLKRLVLSLKAHSGIYSATLENIKKAVLECFDFVEKRGLYENDENCKLEEISIGIQVSRLYVYGEDGLVLDRSELSRRMESFEEDLDFVFDQIEFHDSDWDHVTMMVRIDRPFALSHLADAFEKRFRWKR